MTELSVELPVKINGVIITEDIIDEIRYLHEEGWGHELNGGIALHNASITSAITLIVGILAEARDKSKYTKEIEVIGELYYVNESISRLKLPDQFLQKAG